MWAGAGYGARSGIIFYLFQSFRTQSKSLRTKEKEEEKREEERTGDEVSMYLGASMVSELVIHMFMMRRTRWSR